MNINTHDWALYALICPPFHNLSKAVKLPWIFPGAPLSFNGAPGNIQGTSNLTPRPSVLCFHPHSLSVSLTVYLSLRSQTLVSSLFPSVRPPLSHCYSLYLCLSLTRHELICLIWDTTVHTLNDQSTYQDWLLTFYIICYHMLRSYWPNPVTAP